MDLLTAIIAVTVALIVAYLIIVIHAATMRVLRDPEEADRPEARLIAWPKWLAALVVVLLLVWMFYRVREILLPFIFGGLTAYILNPVIDRLERRGWSRARSIGVIFGGFLLLFIVTALLIIPALVAEATKLADNYPAYVHQVRYLIAGARHAAIVKAKVVGLVPNAVRDAFSSLGEKAQQYALSLLQQTSAWLTRSFFIVLMLVITPIVAFWLLRDYHLFGAQLLRLVPERHRGPVLQLSREINVVAGGYLLGLALMSAFVAAYASIALLAFNVSFAIFLGLVTGVLYVVPYVGYPAALVTVALVMAVTGKGLITILIVAGILILGNVISDYLVSPRVIGKRVGLHPLVLIFAVLAGGSLFQFVGVILAVPAAGVIKVILVYLWPELFHPKPPEEAVPV